MREYFGRRGGGAFSQVGSSLDDGKRNVARSVVVVMIESRL